MIVFIPGTDFDQWVQFGMRNEGVGLYANSISIVAVQKTDPKTGKALPQPVGWYNDFFRTREKKAWSVTGITTRLKDRTKLENCYICHKDAVLPFLPDSRSFDAKYKDKLKDLNRVIAQYGPVKSHGIDESAWGPAMGIVDAATRTDSFLKSCSKKVVTSPEQFKKFREAMNCSTSGCHDGNKLTVLNVPSGLQTLDAPPRGPESLMRALIRGHRKMPAGSAGKNLSDGERKALFECLVAEYYGDDTNPGQLKNWLFQPDCWQNTDNRRHVPSTPSEHAAGQKG